MLSLAVAADDRTGALEVAAACVDAGWAGVPTVPFGVEAPPGAADVLVVDLGSRHLDRDRAAARAVSMMEIAADRHAHKIDSLLRGNWAVELVSRAGTGRRVAVVPALPSQGRW
nr:Hrp-dependent type III effector protein [Acidimicrobiia bacterium]